jgi:hypothetical protein
LNENARINKYRYFVTDNSNVGFFLVGKYKEIISTRNPFEKHSDTQKYILEYSMQYSEFDFSILLYTYFQNEKHASIFAEYSSPKIFLTAEAVLSIFTDLNVTVTIASEDKIQYKIKVFNPKKKKIIGKPLSLEDINLLIEADKLEEVIFSDEYMTSPEDYDELPISLIEFYQLLKKKYAPQNDGYYHFECLSYGIYQ